MKTKEFLHLLKKVKLFLIDNLLASILIIKHFFIFNASKVILKMSLSLILFFIKINCAEIDLLFGFITLFSKTSYFIFLYLKFISIVSDTLFKFRSLICIFKFFESRLFINSFSQILFIESRSCQNCSFIFQRLFLN